MKPPGQPEADSKRPSFDDTGDGVERELNPLEGSTREEDRRLRVLTIVTAIMLVMAPFFVYRYFIFQIPSISIAMIATATAGVLNLGWARLRRNSWRGGWIATLILFALLVFSNFHSGGFYDPNFGWLYVFPMLAALLVDARAGWVVTGLVLVLTIAFWLAPEFGYLIPDRIPVDQHSAHSLANRVSAVVAIGAILASLASQQRFSRTLLEQANQELRKEMTNRVQIQERLIQTERVASMGQLAAGLAHEINNPLTYVIGNLELVQAQINGPEFVADAQLHREMESIVNEALEGALRVANLVRDLRTFAHVDDEISEGGISVNTAVERASRFVAAELRHRAQLEIDLEPNLRIFGNEGRFQQVLVNLLVNAAQSIDPGAADSEFVRIRAMRSGERILVEISDTGRGMPAELIERVFEPFVTTKHTGEASGLGLFISNNIIESMNGSIEVRSEANTGTTFSLSLVPFDDDLIPEAPSEQPLNLQVTDHPLRILVIDDEEHVLLYLRRAFPDHDVHTEKDTSAALRRILESDYDIILCDIMMPNMTGSDLHAELERTRPDMADRMFFMTAGTYTQANKAFLAKMAGRWVEKPITVGKIWECIRWRFPEY